MINHLNSFRYVELDGEFIETLFQHFEEVPQKVAVTKTAPDSQDYKASPPDVIVEGRQSSGKRRSVHYLETNPGHPI